MPLIDELGDLKLIWDKTGIAFSKKGEKNFVPWSGVNKISIEASGWKSPLLSFFPYRDIKLVINYDNNQTFEDDFGQIFLFSSLNMDSNINQGLIAMVREVKPELLNSITFVNVPLDKKVFLFFTLKWVIIAVLIWTVFWIILS